MSLASPLGSSFGEHIAPKPVMARKLTLLLGASMAIAGCLPESAAVAQAPLAAYESGRRRELDLTVAALSLIACASTANEHAVAVAAAATDHIETEGARVAAMRLSDYRALVARVDSQLVLDARSRVPNLTPRLAHHLDSLRVALVVMRARVAAMSSTPYQGREKSCH